MPNNFYPTGVVLGVRLVAAGLVSNPPTTQEQLNDLDAACVAAWQAWEGLTGFTPFLAETVDSTHYFDPDGSRIVDLLGGFVSITGVGVNSNAQTLNTGYRTMPMNAAAQGKPITYLKFDGYNGAFVSYYAPLLGQAGSVAVTGKRGAYTNLPLLAEDAILSLAIQNLLGDLEFAKFRGLKGWVIGSDERTYDQQAFGRYNLTLQASIDQALSRYRRIRVA